MQKLSLLFKPNTLTKSKKTSHANVRYAYCNSRYHSQYHQQGLSFIELISLTAILSSITVYTLQQLAEMKEEIRYTEVKTVHGSFMAAVTVYHMLWQAQRQNVLKRGVLAQYQSIPSIKGFPISPNYKGTVTSEHCEFVWQDIFDPAPKVSSLDSPLNHDTVATIDTQSSTFVATAHNPNQCRYTYIKHKPEAGELAYNLNYDYLNGQITLGTITIPK